MSLGFGISFYVSFSAVLQLSPDEPVMTEEGNRITWQILLLSFKSLATFSHAPGGIQTKTAVRDRSQSAIYVSIKIS